jgi:hypothetical protein
MKKIIYLFLIISSYSSAEGQWELTSGVYFSSSARICHNKKCEVNKAESINTNATPLKLET